MAALIVLVWLGFQGLAVCVIGGMLDMGFNAGDSILIAIVVVTIGAMITRAMYRKSYVIRSSLEAAPHKALGYPQTSPT